VLLAKSKETGVEVAVKPYTSVGISKEEQRVLRNEVEIFLSLDHPHVARLIAVYEEKHRLLLVMEVCKGGEILDAVTKKGFFSEAQAASIVEQMLLSVNYLHAKHIVHRDLKLDNFLYESEDKDHVKLIDFGMSRYWTNNRKMKLACGTVGYMAPECLSQSYTIACDLWSMGVTTYVLLSGRMPFEGNEQQMMEKTKCGTYSMESPQWASISEEGVDFVHNLMERDVNKRMTAEVALQHPWIMSKGTRSSGVQELDANILRSLQSFAETSEFRRVCLQLMTYSLSLEDRKQVRDSFLQIDQAGTGQVSLAELRKVLADHVSDQEAKQIFASLDTTSDDKINYTDFLAAMLTSRIVQNEGHMRAAFNRFDREGNGTISLANLKHVLGNTHKGDEIDELFKQIDVSHDGLIQFDEFMTYIQGDNTDEAHQEAICKVIDAASVESRESMNAGEFRVSVHSIGRKDKKQKKQKKQSDNGSPDTAAQQTASVETPKTVADEQTPLTAQPQASAEAAEPAKSPCCCVQ
jgi:calcium-dependent protein kinase